MKKLILYPFSPKTAPTLYVITQEISQITDNYELYGIVSEAFGGLTISDLCNREISISIKLTTIEALTVEPDNTIFLQLYYEKTQWNKTLVQRVNTLANERHIPIFQSLLNIPDLYSSTNHFRLNLEKNEFRLHKPVLKSINIPVIGVCAVFPHADTSEVVSTLKTTLKEELSVSAVYSNPIFRNSLSNFIDLDLLKSLSFEQRIFYVNWFFNRIITLETSNVLIVELPGSVIGLNSRVLLGGGEYPFIFSQAIGLDYTICSVPANEITSYSFPHLLKYLESHFGMQHISFHASNRYYFFEKEAFNGDIPNMFVSAKYITDQIDKVRSADPHSQIYNFLDRNDIFRWCKMK